MSGNVVRLNAISSITTSSEVNVGFDFVASPTSELWGENVFGLNEMAQRLPEAVFKSLKKTITSGQSLDLSTADAVAEAMKTWAIYPLCPCFLSADRPHRRET